MPKTTCINTSSIRVIKLNISSFFWCVFWLKTVAHIWNFSNVAYFCDRVIHYLPTAGGLSTLASPALSAPCLSILWNKTSRHVTWTVIQAWRMLVCSELLRVYLLVTYQVCDFWLCLSPFPMCHYNTAHVTDCSYPVRAGLRWYCPSVTCRAWLCFLRCIVFVIHCCHCFSFVSSARTDRCLDYIVGSGTGKKVYRKHTCGVIRCVQKKSLFFKFDTNQRGIWYQNPLL